jgi:hypothetical protein
MIRLKFTFSRAATVSSEQIPGREKLTEEDVVLGLFEGFMNFKKEHDDFNFVLSLLFEKKKSSLIIRILNPSRSILIIKSINYLI